MATGVSQIRTSDTLVDGREVYFRGITPSDRETLHKAFHRLSPASVRSRFFNAKFDLTPGELDFLTEVDFLKHVALVAEIDIDEQRCAVGIGRFVRGRDHPGHAEIALTVADEHQGKGVGKALLKQLIKLAKELGVRHFDAMVLADNKPMSQLMLSTGLKTQSNTSEGVNTISLQL
ncbi:MAG: GNAT family N-acetyltransferase [Gammaproteobacteria bacterium]|nr:GNAT family N-acetyltransferase [Gammaproteobacteria bacterium]